MTQVLHAAWTAVMILQFGGVAVAASGVAVFGFYFIRENGRAARRGKSAIPIEAWLGQGPRFGALIVGVGIVFVVSAFVLALILRGGASSAF